MGFRICWLGMIALCAVLSYSTRAQADTAAPDPNVPSYQKIIAAMMSGYKAIALQMTVADTTDASADFMQGRQEFLSNLENRLKDTVHSALGETFPVFAFNAAAPIYPNGLKAKDILFFQMKIDFATDKADSNAVSGTMQLAAYRIIHMSGEESPFYTPAPMTVNPRTFEIFSPAADAALQSTAENLATFFKEHAPQPVH